MAWHKVPYTNFQDLNLDWIINQIKENVSIIAEYSEAFTELKEFVDDYFENLDVQEEVDDKIERLIAEGRFQASLGIDYDATTEELDFSVTFTDE